MGYQLHGPFPLSSCVWAGPKPRPAFPRDGAGSERWPWSCGVCCHDEVAPDPSLPAGVQVLTGLLGEQPAPRSPRAGMKLALPGVLGESASNTSPCRALAHAPPCSFSRVPSGAGRFPALRASFRLRSAADLGAGASPRCHPLSFLPPSLPVALAGDEKCQG